MSKLINKYSYGIACCRLNLKSELEILMVKKRYTFCYVEFIFGHYSARNSTRIKYLINNMSAEEKLDIASLDFDRMWYRVWLVSSYDFTSDFYDKNFMKLYHRCRNKFTFSFLKNEKIPGSRLKFYLSHSKNLDPFWEIPKGKKNHPQEPELNCAIREFQEEAQINIKDYILLDKTKTLTYSNDRARYVNKYFLSVYCSDKISEKYYIEPRKNLNYKDKRQVSEISEVKWMTLREVEFFDKSKRHCEFVKNVFSIIKNYVL